MRPLTIQLRATHLFRIFAVAYLSHSLVNCLHSAVETWTPEKLEEYVRQHVLLLQSRYTLFV